MRSQSVLFEDIRRPLINDIPNPADFEEFLIDSEGKLWLTSKMDKCQGTSEIHVFCGQGHLLEQKCVKGKVSLYESSQWLVAACEGEDGYGYVYQFDKTAITLLNEWQIDGFLWDLAIDHNHLHAVSYSPKDNHAYLTSISTLGKDSLCLGEGFFPTGIIKYGAGFYVTTCQLTEPNRGKLLQLDESGIIVNTVIVDTSPRQLFRYDGELILHGLNMETGRADHLVYIHLQTLKAATYNIPKTKDIREQTQHLLLYNDDKQSLFYWNHQERKVTSVIHLSRTLNS